MSPAQLGMSSMTRAPFEAKSSSGLTRFLQRFSPGPYQFEVAVAVLALSGRAPGGGVTQIKAKVEPEWC